VLASKQALAAGVATGLDYILDLGQPDPSRADPPPADWSSAVAALQQRLLVDLSAAYDTDAIIQYDATVASPWTTSHANLSALDKWFYRELYLKRELAQGPRDWPAMAVVVDGVATSMGSGVDTPRGRRYDFPDGVEAFQLLTLEMRFVALEIAGYQNASSRVQVSRNANLSSLAPTRSAFVYQTQWFAFPNLVSPLLSWRDPFAIGTWTTNPSTNPLTPVFTQLFGAATNNRTISVGIRYGYELATAPDGETIVPYLPVKYRPKFTYDPTTATGTVQQIIDAVQGWYTQQQPATTGGEWLFGLGLYASVDPQLDLPLLELRVFSTL
jgi:hypothetical protein